MAKSKKPSKSIWELVKRKPLFQMKFVPKHQKILKEDPDLVGQKIINCYEGSRYKLTIKAIYTDEKKQLCIDCLDADQRRRTLLAKDCKLLKKPGIRKKNSKLSNTKTPIKRKRKTTK
jgi:hypothetical protein